jgi:hypothetical protein
MTVLITGERPKSGTSEGHVAFRPVLTANTNTAEYPANNKIGAFGGGGGKKRNSW